MQGVRINGIANWFVIALGWCSNWKGVIFRLIKTAWNCVNLWPKTLKVDTCNYYSRNWHGQACESFSIHFTFYPFKNSIGSYVVCVYEWRLINVKKKNYCPFMLIKTIFLWVLWKYDDQLVYYRCITIYFRLINHDEWRRSFNIEMKTNLWFSEPKPQS